MKRDRRWHEKLNRIVGDGVKEAGSGPINPGPLVVKALRGERPPKRNALAGIEVRREIGGKLRRWHAPKRGQPVFPALLDVFAKMDEGYVREKHMPTAELQKRRSRYQRQGDGCFTKVKVIDQILEQRMGRSEERHA